MRRCCCSPFDLIDTVDEDSTVCQVPADALFHEFRTVVPATIDGIAESGLGHFGSRKKARS